MTVPVLAIEGVETRELLATGGRILLIVVLALVLRAVLHRAIGRLIRQATETSVPVVLRPLREKAPAALLEASPLMSERRRQRADTIGSALRSVSSILVFAVAATTVLGELDVDLRPVLASAGIVGVAAGFGAQNLIRDWLNGMFMILEDQFGVGDVIDAGPATGTVEAVALRTTRLRSVDGTVWHVRNGEMLRVGNMSQGWSRALLDVPVPWGSDVARVRATLLAAASGLRQDEEWAGKVLADPEVWGIESMSSDSLVVRLAVQTAPLEQWAVARELRLRVHAALAAEGTGAEGTGVPESTGGGAGEAAEPAPAPGQGPVPRKRTPRRKASG